MNLVRPQSSTNRFVAVAAPADRRANGAYCDLIAEGRQVARRRPLRQVSLATLLTALAGVAAPGMALAQNLPAASSTQVGEVVVTAEHRRETTTKTPISITALTASTMRQRNIQNITDAMLAAPGVTVGENAGQTVIAIRGVSTNDQQGLSEGSIATYMDGVYFARQSFGDLGFLDLDRLEILRGPQGALYGRNATGGAINYISNDPTDHFVADASVLAGSRNHIEARGDVSGPISPTVSFRLAAFDLSEDGYYTNVYDGHNVGWQRSQGVRSTLQWKPSSNVTVDFSAYYMIKNFSGDVFQGLAPPSAAAIALNPVFGTAIASTVPYQISVNTDPHAKNQAFGAYLRTTWDVTPNIEIHTLSSWSQSRFYDLDLDPDFTTANTGNSNQYQHSISLQQDVYANISSFGSKLRSLIGISAYYDRSQSNYLTELPPPSFGQAFCLGVDFCVLPGSAVWDLLHVNTTSLAGFIDETYSITPRLRINAGVRTTYDKKTAVDIGGFQDTSQPFGVGPVIVNAAGVPNLPVSRLAYTCGPLTPLLPDGKPCYDFDVSWTPTTFKGGIQYDLNDHSMAYFSVNQGFKDGGFVLSYQSKPFNPEKIISYEAGLKGRAFSDRLLYDLSIFHYDYTDLQVQQLVLNNGVPSAETLNAGRAHANGVNLAWTGVLSDHFSIDLNGAYMRAVFDQFCAVDQIPPGATYYQNDASCTALGFEGHEFAGTQLPRAPDLTGTLGLNYKTRINDFASLTLRAEVYHSSSYNFRPFTVDPGAVQPQFSLVNLYGTVHFDRFRGVELNAFVKNLNNKAYLVNGQAVTLTESSYGYYAAPRTFGVGVSAHF